MKAVVLRSFGGPEVLSFEDAPKPVPAKGEVLVKVDTAGVGKPDVLFRMGSYPWAPPPPLIIGNEMAGHIVEIGDGVADFAIGDAVHVLNANGGCNAEYVAVPSELMTRLPSDGDLERSVGALNFLLAYCLLHEFGRAEEGQWLYLNGASGGAGVAIIQMAKLAGMKVIAGCSTREKCDFARSYGADHVVNYGAENVRSAVLDFTGGCGVNLFLDQFVGPNFSENFDIIAPMGQIIVYNYVGGMPGLDTLEKLRTNISKCIAMRWFSLHYLDQDLAKRADLMRRVMDLLINDTVENPIFARYPLALASDAHALLDSGAVRGKLVLKPGLSGGEN